MLNVMQMAYHCRKSLSKGVYHDLEKIYDDINLKYFNQSIEAAVLWGRFGGPTPKRRSIKLGSYCAKRKRITIHPALDQACVPKLCVERVLHHEMLHQKFPAIWQAGRRYAHHTAFKQAESTFEEALHADTWFKAHLNRLFIVH